MDKVAEYVRWTGGKFNQNGVHFANEIKGLSLDIIFVIRISS